MEPIRLVGSTFYNEREMLDGLIAFLRGANKLSMGDICAQYEKKFAEVQGRQFGVSFNSGSSANLALVQALLNLGRLKAGAKVGVSAVTWSTNIMPLMQLGLTPVLIDVDINTLNISAQTVVDAFQKSKFEALFVTNLLGLCSNLSAIRRFCDDQSILLMEDNCESLGSVFEGTKLGNFGLASTFSTFVGHHLSTVEGGMVCTDDYDLEKMLKIVRAHGWIRNLDDDSRAEIRIKYEIDKFYEQYSFIHLGYNLRPTEITGFLGLSQLNYINQIIVRREENFSYFSAAAESNPNIIKLDTKGLGVVSNMAFPVICSSREHRDALIERFHQAKVESRPIVGGNMARQPFFRRAFPSVDAEDFPNSNHIHDCGFYFPNHPEMTVAEIDRLCKLLGPFAS